MVCEWWREALVFLPGSAGLCLLLVCKGSTLTAAPLVCGPGVVPLHADGGGGVAVRSGAMGVGGYGDGLRMAMAHCGVSASFTEFTVGGCGALFVGLRCLSEQWL